MDPTAAFIKLIEAHEDDNMIELMEAYQDLNNWLNAGGFLPELSRLGEVHTRAIIEWILREVSIAVVAYETPDTEK